MDRLHQRLHQDFARLLHFLGQVVRGGLTVDGKVDDDLVLGVGDVAVFLLDLLAHVDGDRGLGVAVADQVVQLLVDRVAGDREADLVVFAGDGAVHAAQVARAGADVDHQDVAHPLHAVGDGEWLGHDHHRVQRLLAGVDDRLLVLLRRVRRHPHHAEQQVVAAGVDQVDEVLHQ